MSGHEQGQKRKERLNMRRGAESVAYEPDAGLLWACLAASVAEKHEVALAMLTNAESGDDCTCSDETDSAGALLWRHEHAGDEATPDRGAPTSRGRSWRSS